MSLTMAQAVGRLGWKGGNGLLLAVDRGAQFHTL